MIKAEVSNATPPQSKTEGENAANLMVMGYLKQLGIEDPAQLEAIAKLCLAKARTKVKPGSTVELSRRALKEIQKNINEAIAQVLNLTEAADAQKIVAARAALLLCSDKETPSTLAELRDKIYKVLPQATPQEAPLRMPEQPISFFFDVG